MELPKNITQIGATNMRCKIYIEDYVISYLKQLNQVAGDKEIAVALYGVRKEENDVTYLFLYGASKLNFLQRESRHLSQAQQQEIERLRVKYFGDYIFLGYRLLNGEMIEGFHICEQGICRYVAGYVQFYEKNDSMLAYMLDVRQEVQPETVDLEKYDTVRKRQEERKNQNQVVRKQETVVAKQAEGINLRGMRVAVVAVFALLCVVGLTSTRGEGKWGELQAAFRQMAEGAMEQQIPDATEVVAESRAIDTIITEDKLAEAILQENANQIEDVVAQEPISEPVSAPGISDIPIQESVEAPITVQAPVIVEEPVVVEEPPTVEDPVVAQPVAYTIQEGDTLIGISLINYGTDARVQDICTLNEIGNPDDIKVGQKILLP